MFQMPLRLPEGVPEILQGDPDVPCGVQALPQEDGGVLWQLYLREPDGLDWGKIAGQLRIYGPRPGAKRGPKWSYIPAQPTLELPPEILRVWASELQAAFEVEYALRGYQDTVPDFAWVEELVRLCHTSPCVPTYP